MSLHGQIINMTADAGNASTDSTRIAYLEGHRDARHVAAELALKSSVELSELRLLVRGIVDNRSACFLPNDKDGLLNWDGRALRVLGEA